MRSNRSHCPINFALEVFGDKWTLLILRDLALFRKTTFSAFLESPEQISTNILADRLARLEAHGIVDKRADPGNGRVYHYTLTQKGLDLVPVLLEMIAWGARYDPATAAPRDFIARIRRDRENLLSELVEALAEG